MLERLLNPGGSIQAKGKKMTRNLKALGLAFVAALVLSAVAASGASAATALFTTGAGAAESSLIHGEQGAEGAAIDTFTFEGLPAMTCTTVRETGFLEHTGVDGVETHTVGNSGPSVTLEPTYETCHVVLAFITRTITITMNGCRYTFHATKNTPAGFFADLHIKCPTGKEIEIHVYNTSNHIDTGAPICTYDVPPQTPAKQIELTNKPGTPDDIVKHINVTVKTKATITGGLCGSKTEPNLTYVGTHTLQATNVAGKFVNTTVS
jgi:hypothetical protein